MDTRSESLARVIERIGVLTRDFAASGTHPFKDRRLGRAPMSVLFTLSRTDGLGVAELAHRLSVTSGAISQTVDMLREAGLVVSEVNPQDARGRHIRLTAEARREVTAFESAYIEALAPRFDALSTQQVVELERILSAVTVSGEMP